MKLTIFIPTTYNDGSEVPPSELSQLVDGFWSPFGGVTIEGTVEGRWIHDGQTYDDVLLKVSVVIDALAGLARALAEVDAIGRRLEQKAMYVELLGADGPYIVPVPE